MAEQGKSISRLLDELLKAKQTFKELKMTRQEVGEKLESALDALEFSRSILDTVREPLLVLDRELRVVFASRIFYHVFNLAPAETEGRLVYELGEGEWDIAELRELLNEILPQNTSFDDFEVDYEFPGLGRRVMLLNARRIYDEEKRTQLILLAIEDITRRKQAEREVALARNRLRATLYSIGDAVITTDSRGC